MALSVPEQLKIAQQAVEDSPRDAKKRFALAELLKKSGNLRKAAVQYLETTALDPAFFLAYHRLIDSDATNDQLDEAIERLNKLKEAQPTELMLRVALSEVLEKRGDVYKAARALVDIQFVNGAIPAKYQDKINNRIHYLLTKAKEEKIVEKAKQTASQNEEELDSVPLPMPDKTSTDLSTSKLKDDSNVTEGYGHTKLLP